MIIGMATSKLTITLQRDQLEQIHALIAAGQAGTVSGFVQHAVNIALHDAAGWQELLNSSLAETGGPLTQKERQWADENLSGPPPQKKMPARKHHTA